MKSQLILISAPWASPLRPSISIGLLSSYLKKEKPTYPVRVKSAFIGIPVYAKGGNFNNLFFRLRDYEEYVYMILLLRRFPQFFNLRKEESEKHVNLIIRKLNNLGKGESIDIEIIKNLEDATIDYIENEIVPDLSKSKLNIIGFSLNYYQLYASLFILMYLNDLGSKYKKIVVFGGMAAAFPSTNLLLKKFNIEGLIVIGEGERKIKNIIDQIEQIKDFKELIIKVENISKDIYSISNSVTDIYERQVKDRKSNLDNQLIPDYDEYFSFIEKTCESPDAVNEFKKNVVLMFEGSRGCYHRCSFCGHNYLNPKYKSKKGEDVYSGVKKLSTKYKVFSIYFTDNLCNGWINSYVDKILKSNIQIKSTMELRAIDDEFLWVKIALSGVHHVQVGIEALAPTLLRKMNKKTSLISNLRSQKYIRELKIESGANLITYFPNSTIDEINFTKQILIDIPHFDFFDLSPYGLTFGSVIYDSLTIEEKEWCVLNTVQTHLLTEPLYEYCVDWRFEKPGEIYESSLVKEWGDFSNWYKDFKMSEVNKNADLKCFKIDVKRIMIHDTRYGEFKNYLLENEYFDVLEMCHEGLLLNQLYLKLPMYDNERVKNALEYLINLKVIIDVDGYFLSIVLREKEYLIRKYFCGCR